MILSRQAGSRGFRTWFDFQSLCQTAAMPVQDDVRENQMIQLFNLTVPLDRSRADIDAHLALD